MTDEHRWVKKDRTREPNMAAIPAQVFEDHVRELRGNWFLTEAPAAPPPAEPPPPLAYFHGTVDGHGEGFWIIRVRPGEGPDGTAAVDPLACCTTFDAAIAAGRLLSGVADGSGQPLVAAEPVPPTRRNTRAELPEPV